MLSSEDDPEAEEVGIEYALPDVTEQQHEGHVKPQCHPLHRHYYIIYTHTLMVSIIAATFI